MLKLKERKKKVRSDWKRRKDDEKKMEEGKNKMYSMIGNKEICKIYMNKN